MEIVREGMLRRAGVTLTVRVYRDGAHRCGLSGNHLFVVVDPANSSARRPLWVRLKAGGGGYFDEQGVYHTGGVDPHNTDPLTELSEDELMSLFLADAFDGERVRDSLVGRRLSEGYRFLLLGTCDHDVHAGIGQPHPNHPEADSPDPPTVDGLLASMAALDFTGANFETGSVVLHGLSAGAFGAYNMAYAYAREGTFVSAAVADSGLATPRMHDAFDANCTLGQQRDRTLSLTALEAKLGPFFSHPSLVPEGAIARGFRDVPLFFVAGGVDDRCCSSEHTLAMGLENCAYVHGGLTEAVAIHAPDLHRSHIVPGGGHVLTDDEDAELNDTIDAWLAPHLEKRTDVFP